MTKFFTPRIRRWVYSVCIAAVPALVYFGLLPPEAAPVILPLILAVLNIQDDPAETVTTYSPPPGEGYHGE